MDLKVYVVNTFGFTASNGSFAHGEFPEQTLCSVSSITVHLERKLCSLWYNAILRGWQTAGEGLRRADAARLLCSQSFSCCWSRSTGLHFNSNTSLVPSVPSTVPAHFLFLRCDPRISLSDSWGRTWRLETMLKAACVWCLLKACASSCDQQTNQVWRDISQQQ